MKKIMLFMCVALLFMGCQKDEEQFGGQSKKTENGSFNFYGYQLDDVKGFERHELIDAVQFPPNGTVIIADHYKIETKDNSIEYWEANNASPAFSEIIKKGSTVSLLTYDGEPYDWMIGIKHGKIWIGQFEPITKKQINEWTDTALLERNIKIDLGYGEYEEHYINSLHTYIYPRGENFAAVISAPQLEKPLGLYLLENNKMFKSNLVFDIKFNIYHIYDWYKGSILVRGFPDQFSPGIYSIVSSDGSIIDSFEEPFFDIPLVPWKPKQKVTNVYAVSYKEWINLFYGVEYGFNGGIRKTNFENKTLWFGDLDLAMEPDSRATHTLIDNSTDLWTFKVDIVNRDGSKRTVNFKLNINTGKTEIIK